MLSNDVLAPAAAAYAGGWVSFCATLPIRLESKEGMGRSGRLTEDFARVMCGGTASRATQRAGRPQRDAARLNAAVTILAESTARAAHAHQAAKIPTIPP